MTDPSEDLPLYNSRIIECHLKLVRQKYSSADLEELLRHAGIRECEVADQGHWFTQRQVELFHEKLVQVTGNPSISREAGRFAASPRNLGFLREFLLGLIGPEYVLLLISKVATNFSRSSRCSSRRIGPCEIEVTVVFEKGVQEKPFQCENRIGYLEAVFLLFNHDFPEIRHTHCIFTGDSVCRYNIRWQRPRLSQLSLARRLSLLLLPLALVPVLRFSSAPWLTALCLGAIPLHILFAYLARESERTSLLASLSSMRNSSETLLAEVQGSYDNTLLIHEIGKAISRKTELEEILRSVNQVLLKRLNYGRGIILLADETRSRLVLTSCFGFAPEEEETLQRLEHRLDPEDTKGVLVRSFLRQEAFLVNGLVRVEELALPENYAFFTELGVRSFICAPIVCDGEALGVLAVDDAKRKGDLLKSDLNMIQGVAPILGIAIRNAMLLAKERSLSDQLRRASEHLERRVEERTAALTRAHEELESLYDSVSHDLRTPLRIIYGYGELLLDDHGEHLDATARSYLESIIRGGEQMEATLDKMLDYSKAKMMELTLEPVDLSLLAAQICNDLKVTDKRRVLSVRIQDNVLVVGDASLLRSVMENLIGNAWKYCSGKGVTRIEFGMEQGVCYLSDNGAGFDMAFSDRLFMPFQRLHDTRSFPGHGLGLATVRRMVERMGGKIWAAGRPGEGATFYFTLPLPQRGDTAAEAEETDPEQLRVRTG